MKYSVNLVAVGIAMLAFALFIAIPIISESKQAEPIRDGLISVFSYYGKFGQRIFSAVQTNVCPPCRLQCDASLSTTCSPQ